MQVPMYERLADVCEEIFSKPIRRATLSRWAKYGRNGVFIADAFKVGNEWFVVRENFVRFLAASSVPSSHRASEQPRTDAARSKAIEAAEKQLADAGI